MLDIQTRNEVDIRSGEECQYGAQILRSQAEAQHAQRGHTMGTDHWALLIATLKGVELPGLMLFW